MALWLCAESGPRPLAGVPPGKMSMMAREAASKSPSVTKGGTFVSLNSTPGGENLKAPCLVVSSTPRK